MTQREEIWIVNSRWQRPKTWRDWLAAVGYVAIGVAVIALALVVASTLFVVAIVVGLIAVGVGIVSFLLSRGQTRPRPSDEQDRRRIEHAQD